MWSGGVAPLRRAVLPRQLPYDEEQHHGDHERGKNGDADQKPGLLAPIGQCRRHRRRCDHHHWKIGQFAHRTQPVMTSNITDVQRGASETGSASSQVLSAAQSLSRDSNRLKLEVGKFLNSVRAA